VESQLFCRIQIDVIEAGTTQCDEFNAMLFQLFQNRATAVIVNENTDAFAAISRFCRFLCE
jgi:hypothetical protein